jgi:hypothetical protein
MNESARLLCWTGHYRPLENIVRVVARSGILVWCSARVGVASSQIYMTARSAADNLGVMPLAPEPLAAATIQ